VGHLDIGHLQEQHLGQVRRTASAWGRHRELARTGFGVVDKLLDRMGRRGVRHKHEKGKLVRVLATTGAKRDAAAPDVPTIAEAGVRGYDVTAWQALFIPDKTPPAIVRKISADTNTALADPAIKDKLAQTGYAAGGSSPEELGTLLKSEIVRWSALVKSVGIALD
jgi:hypothetical protein